MQDLIDSTVTTHILDEIAVSRRVPTEAYVLIRRREWARRTIGKIAKRCVVTLGSKMSTYLKVYGRVQGVMFRKTVVTLAKQFALRAGATNSRDNSSEVFITLEGGEGDVEQFIQRLLSAGPLNGWGANVERVDRAASGHSLSEHEVCGDCCS